jgi:hypothetical protein
MGPADASIPANSRQQHIFGLEEYPEVNECVQRGVASGKSFIDKRTSALAAVDLIASSGAASAALEERKQSQKTEERKNGSQKIQSRGQPS